MKKTFLFQILRSAVAICTFAIAAISCSEDDTSSTGEDVVQTGTISGVVSDTLGDPISGVSVAISSLNLTTSTDESGAYSFTDVTIGSCSIEFTKENYQTSSVAITSSTFKDGVATVDVFMEYANAKIMGVVTDSTNNNEPMAGATVSLSSSTSTTTGSDGAYLFEGLTIDDYSVTFSMTDYTSVVKSVAAGDFVEGVATVDVVMGSSEMLPGITVIDLQDADKWYYNEYTGGRNAEAYPHWDWSTDYMCTLMFVGNWEEQNEGTTLRINNDSEDQSNPADLVNFDSFTYGSKYISEDNSTMTLQVRTHDASDEAPANFGVQVIDLSQAEPTNVQVGGVKTLSSEDYVDFDFDLAEYIGKEIIIAIGTYRAETGDYWKQLVLRRIAFSSDAITGWGWLPGSEITNLESTQMTHEIVRSTMIQQKQSFTGISPVSGSRDSYVDAYQAWRDVAHIGAEWFFAPLNKDPEPFASEGFVIKTRSDASINATIPEAYIYAKFAIAAGCNTLSFRARNFSETNASYFKFTAIDESGSVTVLTAQAASASSTETTESGCQKFIHSSGSASAPDEYALFTYDLSQFDGNNIVLMLGVYKGEDSNDEDKIAIYSIDLE